MFQIADLLAIVAGAIAGAIAFLPFVFTLKPVLDDKQNADMLKGMVSCLLYTSDAADEL